MRFALTCLSVLALSACAVPGTKMVAPTFEPPMERTRIVIMQPDVQMTLLTAGGLQEPRADWTSQSETNFLAAFDQILSHHGHDVVVFDPSIAAADAQEQLVLLHEAVGASAVELSSTSGTFVPSTLPTKVDGFDWTLGEDATQLREAYDADLALFLSSRGSFASGGRMAVTVVAAALWGGAPSLGVRVTRMSLVDLRTGDIVWMNFTINGDPRSADGAQWIVDHMSGDIPL